MEASVNRGLSVTVTVTFANSSTQHEIMTDDGNGEFIGVDLGDGHPRGVHVLRFQTSNHRFLSTEFQTRTAQENVVYTPNVKNSDYTQVYTEMAHPPATKLQDGSYMTFYSGEKETIPTDGYNAPRNIGFAIVSNDLSTVNTNGWITDLTPDTTNKDEMHNAIRVKTAKVNDDLILIIYELWTKESYIRTEVLGISTVDGSVVMDPISFPINVRLSPKDTVYVEHGRVIFFGGESDGAIVRYTLQTEDLPSP